MLIILKYIIQAAYLNYIDYKSAYIWTLISKTKTMPIKDAIEHLT